MAKNSKISQKRNKKTEVQASQEHKKLVGSKEYFLELLKKATNHSAFDKKQ